MSSAVTVQAPVITAHSDGTKTLVRFYLNKEGKKVKVTQKIREVDPLVRAQEAVAARQSWVKYGADAGQPRGPSKTTTSVEDQVTLKLFPKSVRPKEEATGKPLKKTTVSGITCRTCGGSHYTHHCPYKDRLGGFTEDPALSSGPSVPGAAVPGAVSAPGRYQPPQLRGVGGIVPRPGPMEERDESATLRVSNLPENVDDMGLRMLFNKAGRLTRSHVARDRNTGMGRGFAFFSYETVREAEEARKQFDGMPIGHLIMRVEFSKK